MDNEKYHSPDLYRVWNEKCAFLKKAIDQNPFGSTHFMWADMGGFRDETKIEMYKEWPSQKMMNCIADNKVVFLSVGDEKELNGMIGQKPSTSSLKNRIGGGFFGGCVNVLGWYIDTYYRTLNSLFQEGHFVGNDQLVITRIYLDHPSRFHLVQAPVAIYGSLPYLHDHSWFHLHSYLVGMSDDAKVFCSKIVVLIPLYTGIEYLSEAISSVVHQTYKNWEILIGVNGHSPSSPEYARIRDIVSEFGLGDRIKIIDCPVKSKPDTLMFLKKYVDGEWVALLDADDVFERTKLKKQAVWMDKYDVIGTAGYYFCNDKSRGLGDIPIHGQDLSHFNFLSVNPLLNSSVLMRKDCMVYESEDDEKMNPLLRQAELSGLDDYSCWLKLRYVHNKRIYNLDERLLYHRLYQESCFNSKGMQAQGLQKLFEYWKSVLN